VDLPQPERSAKEEKAQGDLKTIRRNGKREGSPLTATEQGGSSNFDTKRQQKNKHVTQESREDHQLAVLVGATRKKERGNPPRNERVLKKKRNQTSSSYTSEHK